MSGLPIVGSASRLFYCVACGHRLDTRLTISHDPGHAFKSACPSCGSAVFTFAVDGTGSDFSMLHCSTEWERLPRS